MVRVYIMLLFITIIIVCYINFIFRSPRWISDTLPACYKFPVVVRIARILFALVIFLTFPLLSPTKTVLDSVVCLETSMVVIHNWHHQD